jgi:hypothetical protein
MADPLLDAIGNLSRFHREHEKFYAQHPRQQAVEVQRSARTLCAPTDRWAVATVETIDALYPYEGRPDRRRGRSGGDHSDHEKPPDDGRRLHRDRRLTRDGDGGDTAAILLDYPPWPTCSATDRSPGRRRAQCCAVPG